MKGRTVIVILLLTGIGFSCSKNTNTPDSEYKISYGDSIIYLRNQNSDYIVYPTENRAGTYTGFPEGIQIDDNTGAINVSKSETGLRYRITFTAADGSTNSTVVVLSGINFKDKFYHLSQGDSVAFPVYNANASATLPVAGSLFDEGNQANSGGCSVKTVNGQINLAQTVRNGVFGNTPVNDLRRDFDILYRLNDPSNKSLNKLRVRVYYYNTMNDVAADLLQDLNDRETQGVFIGNTYNSIPDFITARTTAISKVAKPRPPCVIIVGQ